MLAQQQLELRVAQHLQRIYEGILTPHQLDELNDEVLGVFELSDVKSSPATHENLWSEKDVVLISYADTIFCEGEKPLATLKTFLDTRLKKFVNSVHILPFFPYSSDDGFSVIDYSSVNESHGDWSHIKAIAEDYKLMSDLVVNHCSSRGLWFQNFVKGLNPGKEYFFTAKKSDDVSKVVRPRSSDLLRETETADGTQYVWCTFSHDQVDFNFRNPALLLEFCQIIRQYLDAGISIFRLDAIAFVWKVIGTSSINLPQTHEIVRLFRTLIEHAKPEAIILTETNIPNKENLDYFGNANEAHWVYNFALPPLLLHALLSGNSKHLKHWLMSMPPAQNGTAYLNFIASHDGIGLRPVEGILDDDEQQSLIETMIEFGGRVSWRALADGQTKPYEINISLIDALQGTLSGLDDFGIERFICAHAIMFALEGVPAVYLHSFVATQNDYERMEHTGHNRAINRHQWNAEELGALLDDKRTSHSRVAKRLGQLLEIRQKQPAFHPNATQFTLQLDAELFGFWRQSSDRRQSIFCISNITSNPVQLQLSQINMILTDPWYELIGGEVFDDLESSVWLNPYQTVWISNAGKGP
ncbi:MAG: sugar phosphorylase [Pseudomonadales bacterium]